jgi:hypothetical protein
LVGSWEDWKTAPHFWQRRALMFTVSPFGRSLFYMSLDGQGVALFARELFKSAILLNFAPVRFRCPAADNAALRQLRIAKLDGPTHFRRAQRCDRL